MKNPFLRCETRAFDKLKPQVLRREVPAFEQVKPQVLRRVEPDFEKLTPRFCYLKWRLLKIESTGFETRGVAF